MSKKMRLHPEPLHAPRATQQHAHPAPPKAHRSHADSRPCGQGAGDMDPLLAPLPPSCCMTSACVQRQDQNVCHLGFGEQGSLEASLLVLALPGGTHAVGKVGTHGALETPLGLSARPRGRRQETKMAGGGLAAHHCRDFPLGAGQAWLRATRTWRGVPCHLRELLPELVSAEKTVVESLSP